MTRRIAAGIALAVAVGACGNSTPKLPPAVCEGSAHALEQALAGAPGAVVLGGSVPLSQCIARAASQGDLEAVGGAFAVAADDLARAAPQSTRAAVKLGYLVGATERGASHNGGVAAELVRRIELDGALSGAGNAQLAALHRGIEAGRRLG